MADFSRFSVKSVAAMLPAVRIDAACSAGRVLAAPSVSCPPAVSPVMMGERITSEDVEIMEYYGISSVDVVADL